MSNNLFEILSKKKHEAPQTTDPLKINRAFVQAQLPDALQNANGTWTFGISKNIGVFPKIGDLTPKWMVKIMEKSYLKWMIWGENPLLSETSI